MAAWSLAAFFLLLAPCASGREAAAAGSDSRGRFATRDEVIGFWRLLPFPPELAAANVVDPWSLPYQYFAFFPDGVMVSHMATQDPADTPATLKTLRGILPPTMRFSFENGFCVIRHADNPGADEIWGVNLFTARVEAGGAVFEPGDLLMSLDDGQGNVIYRRHLRRLK